MPLDPSSSIAPAQLNLSADDRMGRIEEEGPFSRERRRLEEKLIEWGNGRGRKALGPVRLGEKHAINSFNRRSIAASFLATELT